MPDNVASRGRINSLVHDLAKIARPKDKSAYDDNSRNPVKSSAWEIVFFGGLLIHKLMLPLPKLCSDCVNQL